MNFPGTRSRAKLFASHLRQSERCILEHFVSFEFFCWSYVARTDNWNGEGSVDRRKEWAVGLYNKFKWNMENETERKCAMLHGNLLIYMTVVGLISGVASALVTAFLSG